MTLEKQAIAAGNCIFQLWLEGDKAVKKMVEDAVINRHAVPATEGGRLAAEYAASLIIHHCLH
jgi:hypothetical protein